MEECYLEQCLVHKKEDSIEKNYPFSLLTSASLTFPWNSRRVLALFWIANFCLNGHFDPNKCLTHLKFLNCSLMLNCTAWPECILSVVSIYLDPHAHDICQLQCYICKFTCKVDVIIKFYYCKLNEMIGHK